MLTRTSTLQKMDVALADLHVFYQKLRNYHWNVKGQDFFKLHELFQTLYTEAADHIDLLAERMLGMGGRPTSNLRQYLAMTGLKEEEGTPDARGMVTRVSEDMTLLMNSMIEIAASADENQDRTTAALMDEIVTGYEKHLWMMRSFLA